MQNWLDWAKGEPDVIAAHLRKDWRDRGALTAAEAFGEPDEKAAANKGVARAHKNGAMSRFASEATMRHLKTVGLIDGLRIRNVRPSGETERGSMRLWSIADVLKAETALQFADYADFPARRVARLLKELPLIDADGVSLMDSYASRWAAHAFVTLGQEAEDAETREEAESYFRANPEAAEDALRQRDPKLIIADRRWVFGVNLSADGSDLEPFPLAEMKAFRTGEYKVPFLPVLRDGADLATAPEIGRQQAPEAINALRRASVVIELNLFEPMRRFVCLNRTRAAPP